MRSITTSSGGTLSVNSANTDASGYAKTSFNAGAAAGAYKDEASWNSWAKKASFNLLAQPQNAGVALSVNTGNNQTGDISTDFGTALRVRLLNNGAAYAGESIAFSVTQGTATVTSDSGTSYAA